MLAFIQHLAIYCRKCLYFLIYLLFINLTYAYNSSYRFLRMNLNYNFRIYSIQNRNYNSVTLSFVIFSPPRYLLPTIIKRSRNEIGIKKIYFAFTKNILNSIYTECVLLKRANQWKLCLGYI